MGVGASPAQAEASDFLWRRPGADPLRGVSDAEALRKLASGNLVPKLAHQALLSKVQSGQGFPDEIPVMDGGFRFTRMLFGRGVLVPNVIALTAEWPNEASRRVRHYEYRDTDGLVYVLIRPEICGNWSLRIVQTQGQCVRDNALCGPECDSLRRNQI